MIDSFKSLATLLCDGREPDSLVSFGRSGEHTWADFVSQVESLAIRLAKAGPGRWLFLSDDSHACAVAFMALAHTGSTMVMPPNRQPGTIRRIRKGVMGAIVDPELDVEELGSLPVLDPLGLSTSDSMPFAELARDAVAAEFLTSGTTGDAASVPKALRHLDDELASLETRFGSLFPRDARVFATAPHQHFYGILFRVLWPLAAGRPFCTETFLHPEELLARMPDARTAILASTPAHLKRMGSMTSGASVLERCVVVFSSGAPMDEETARAVTARSGVAPFEAFGSTETGGVACRRQLASPLWETFPGVSIAADPDGNLVVRSPFVSSESGEITLGDRVELAEDGRFRLLGRSDRVVKIGGKRLSLPEMEAWLQNHEHVAEVALVALDAGPELRVHAVVVPSASGWAALESEDRRTVARTLTRHIASEWDAILHPRAWRYVTELPRDERGKVSRILLSELFDRSREAAEPLANPEQRVLDPVVLSEDRSDKRLRRRLRVPADLAYLDGHFESFPVVPGVAQLRWVIEAARDLIGREPEVETIEALKFGSVLRPDQAFDLEVTLENPTRLGFRLVEGDVVFASGRCSLRDFS